MTHRIAIFASGNGSNAENIIRHFNHHRRNARVALIITNRPEAGVVERARQLGVPVKTLTRTEIHNPEIMLSLMKEHDISMIVLAGFLLMIPEFLIDNYPGRIINIHPSLLPKFGGKGMYGIHVHRAVAEARETVTGITIHTVSAQYDQGTILFQAQTDVRPTDTPEEIETKIHNLERQHFPQVIEQLLSR
ncbi:MAG: phosphoribosylglycinamide formyltransferase [Paramuribaculum sp.]|nr:phosphoribosylglycinamide formyltransferase [Paramuribaculum sp.]